MAIQTKEAYYEDNEEFALIVDEYHNTETLGTRWEGSIEIFGTDIFKWETSEESLKECLDKLRQHL